MNSLAQNPKLTSDLIADQEALHNDLKLARELALDYQRELSDKTNDHAALKMVLEKTVRDLEQLQTGIAELREERHRLANQAMRAMAFELQLKLVSKERDRLRGEADELRAALVESKASLAAHVEANAARPSENGRARAEEAAPQFISVAFQGPPDDQISITPIDDVNFNGARRLRRRG